MLGTRFATRLNAFKFGSSAVESVISDNAGTLQQLRRVAAVKGLTDVDLNYPDHVFGIGADFAEQVRDLGLSMNGLAMRFGSNRKFASGAFTCADPKIRQEAIDLTKRGIDASRECGADLMTVWLGEDGFDYGFQADYERIWNDEIQAIREIALHDIECRISIEYKPNEPRAFAVLPDLTATLLALAEADCPNLGVTLDFAHMLYGGEHPPATAALAARKSTIFGVHLNDGYGKRDDGLMVGSVHLAATLEFLYQLLKASYQGVIYFDTFPDAGGIDPASECECNIKITKRLIKAASELLTTGELNNAMERQDPVASRHIVNRVISRTFDESMP
ncbi:MAG: sugar phosphate isomerase/epimerase [Albidovulum sp.]|nr:sugar phosphate isomerase/epimerase [Albidovulum sp.]